MAPHGPARAGDGGVAPGVEAGAGFPQLPQRLAPAVLEGPAPPPASSSTSDRIDRFCKGAHTDVGVNGERDGLVFQLLVAISGLDLFRRQLPCSALAFVVASLFYRFGSFALECLGFLATWFLLDMVYEGLARLGHEARAAGRLTRPPT